MIYIIGSEKMGEGIEKGYSLSWVFHHQSQNK